MRPKKQDIVALAVILVLVGSVAGYLAYQQMVMPQTVISRSEILQFSYQEEEVSGLVRFYISLDATGAELELHKFLENINLPYSDLVKYGFPPGTNLSPTKRLTVTFSPAGSPWVYGAVDEKSLVYSDGHQTTPMNREWSYYKVSQWIGESVPYRVKAQGDLANVDRTFLAGKLGLDVGQSIDIGSGIKFTQVGFLGTGYLPPSTDYALAWTDANTMKFVGGDEVTSAFTGAGPMGRGPINLKITGAEGPAMTNDYANYDYVQGKYIGSKRDGYDAWGARNAAFGWIGFDYLWTDIRSQDGQGAVRMTYKNRNDWWCDTNVDMEISYGWTYPTGQTWFKPEVAVVKTDVEDVAVACGLPAEIDLVGETGFDLTFRQVIVVAQASPRVQGAWIDLDLINATDTWDEFIKRTGMDTLPARTPYGFNWATSSSQVDLMPAMNLWTTGDLAGTMVPPSYKSPGQYTTTTSSYAVLTQPSGGLGYPTVILDVPASLFDFDVIMPNWGTPKIVPPVGRLEAVSGEAATFTVNVMNEGPARDAFTGDPHEGRFGLSGLPPEMTVVTGPNTFIDVGETKELQWSIATGTTYEDLSGTGTVTVIASGSGNPDTASFSWSLEGQERPPEKGTLIVTVKDRRDGIIEGAIVRLDGAEQTTGTDGSTTFTNLLAGQTYKVTARDPTTGEEASTNVAVAAGINTCEIWLYGPLPPSIELILVVLGIAISVVAGVVLVGKRQGWWLR